MDINQLRASQVIPITRARDTLQSIEINPVDICNRGCSFCPRGHGYPNTSDRLEDYTSLAINASLIDLNFNGHMTFTGFGEPLLHKRLERQIELITSGLDIKWVEVVTNGDMLTHDRALDLVLSGVTHITVSMYDQDDSKRFEDMLRGLNVTLTVKHLYNGIPNEVNRVSQYKHLYADNIDRPCYLPFYRTFINYDGRVLLCCNDWNKQSCAGNVNDTMLRDIWFGDRMKAYRSDLLEGRRVRTPCAGCNVDGIMHGKHCFDYFKEYYASIEDTGFKQTSFAK